MNRTNLLIDEMKLPPNYEFYPHYFRAIGYHQTTHTTPSLKRADGIASLFTEPAPFIYKNDMIVGSLRTLCLPLTEEEKKAAKEIVSVLPNRYFAIDHYSPDYETVLKIGIGGLLAEIDNSKITHSADANALDFLESMRLSLCALQKRIADYAEHARSLTGCEGYDNALLLQIAVNCEQIITEPPKTFEQGLQLIWMIHTCFLYESRYAMALGRLDQYLYPLYCRDVEANILTKEKATLLLENTLAKICERYFYLHVDDVVNICIGGVTRDNHCAVNELSYCILHAVKNINRPGPNLSARITPDIPDEFLDECLKSIGTGLGYPALMNDVVNMAALRRYGYAEEDVRNYSMVGCIENFITGMQPPWSDGRFDTPRYLEYLFFDGEGYDKTRKGLRTAPLSEITSMDIFMQNLETQLACGVKDYVDTFNNWSAIANPENHTSPFLSCFCKDCIKKGRDINMGGSRYPSVHGAVLMGVGTMSDSLAAIEKVIFCDKEATLSELAEALRCNFVGYERLREKLLAAPKYGNNNDFVDRYAVWFTDYLAKEFEKYHTYDGGGIYVAMAANTSNIYAGKRIGATPDGRLAEEPLSDAASPTYGKDTKGATSTLLSLSKPDYTRCACGTVVNQKYSPSMFSDEKRQKLLHLIKVYFAKGGQEIQINATSAETLQDAMEHPENYPNLVVRVSGYSALYITLAKDVQKDILRRTQQG